jgi:hypothetical protein
VVGLTDVLLELLEGEADGLPEQDVVARARARLGPGASRGPVTKALARDPRFVKGDRLGKPVWRIGEDVELDRRTVRAINHEHDDASHGLGIPVDAARPLDGLGLRDWQVDAFATWVGGGCRGVVEAITGAGKTRLAIAAVRAALARGGRVLVLVPTLDLQDQWGKELRTFIPGAKIGRLGGGGDDDLHDNHVLIATPHSRGRCRSAAGRARAARRRRSAPVWRADMGCGAAGRLSDAPRADGDVRALR